MHVTVTPQPKSQTELAIELSVEEMHPYLAKAAAALSREHPIDGFRPGKLPLPVALERYGAMRVWQEAADQAIRDGYVRAVREQGIRAVGSPSIEVSTLAPENPVRFSATVSVLPAVTLPDLATITVPRRTVHITDADIAKALHGLQRLQPTNDLVDRPAEEADKVVVDMDLSAAGVPLEGGQARDHGILLNEEYYLPRVREELRGVRSGDAKTFSLDLPKDHPQTTIAGKAVDCAVTVKGVYSVAYPAIDDAFAQRLGLPTIDALRTRIHENLEHEAVEKAERTEETDIFDQLIAKSTIAELPELLITSEAHRMIDELDRAVTNRGMSFPEYLQSIKKTSDQLFLDFAPEAVRRVKAALVSRAIAEANADAVAVEERDVDSEIHEQINRYRDDAGVAERIQSEESRDHVRGMLRSKRIAAWLRTQVQWTEAEPVQAERAGTR